MTNFKSHTTFASKKHADGSHELFIQVVIECEHFNFVKAGFECDDVPNPAGPISITLFVSRDPSLPDLATPTPVVFKFKLGLFDQAIHAPEIALAIKEVPFEEHTVRSLFNVGDEDKKKSEKKKKTGAGSAEADPKPKPNFIDV